MLPTGWPKTAKTQAKPTAVQADLSLIVALGVFWAISLDIRPSAKGLLRARLLPVASASQSRARQGPARPSRAATARQRRSAFRKLLEHGG
jgi:hypothetical protein